MGAATTTVLYGLTWVFGAVTFTGGPHIFLWLFTITNSLQGVFFCVFQKDAQDAWVLLFRYGKHRTCRNRKETAGELEPMGSPTISLTSLSSVEMITVEERSDTGGAIYVEDTLEYVDLMCLPYHR